MHLSIPAHLPNLAPWSRHTAGPVFKTKHNTRLAPLPLEGDRTQPRSAVCYLKKLKCNADCSQTGSDNTAGFISTFYLHEGQPRWDNRDGNYRHSTIPRSRWFSTSTSSPRKYTAFSPILEPDLRESNISHKRETILFATLKYEARSQTSP